MDAATSRVTLLDARPEHVRELLPRLREDDKNEIHAAGISCKRALWRSWRGSHLRTVAFVDGEIAAIWGCGGSLLGDEGQPWLLTAPACERVPLAFIKIGRDQTRRMLRVHEYLKGYVWGDHWRAIRTLGLMGFRFGPIVRMPSGVQFLTFSMVRDFGEWSDA